MFWLKVLHERKGTLVPFSVIVFFTVGFRGVRVNRKARILDICYLLFWPLYFFFLDLFTEKKKFSSTSSKILPNGFFFFIISNILLLAVQKSRNALSWSVYSLALNNFSILIWNFRKQCQHVWDCRIYEKTCFLKHKKKQLKNIFWSFVLSDVWLFLNVNFYWWNRLSYLVNHLFNAKVIRSLVMKLGHLG